MSLLVSFVSFVIFISFQATGIYGGDSGDLVTAAATGGVPHPPGYPLYTFLGWLLNHLPLATPAWRVGLLSSIPHAVTIGLVFLFVFQLTKKLMPSLFAAIFLAGNYLFFLYAVTPEVFALFDLFVVLVSYLLYKQKLLLASLVFGLSLTHHHVILFLVPAILYLGWTVSHKRHFLLKLVGFFIVGLLPYLYIPIAARGNSIINWDRAVDLAGFIKLLTRADYGTFVSGGYYGTELIQRVISLKAYTQFLLLDFTWVGVFLAGVGLFSLWRQRRRIFWFFILAIGFLGPIFFFYASFPLVNRFTVGTYERFLLPSYVLLAVAVGVGFNAFAKKTWLAAMLGILLFLIPLSRGSATLWRFWGLRDDHTADYLGQDILNRLPQKSILLMRQDTPLFMTQYVRYALGIRPDVAVIHLHRLESDDYKIILNKIFPSIVLPNIIESNRTMFPMYSNTKLPLDPGWFWVPEGLVYKLTPEKSLPKFSQMKSSNDQIWSTLHNPTTGILSRYNHLMLSDVRDVSAGARIDYGKILLRGNDVESALKEFQTAVSYSGDTRMAESYTYVGLANLFLGKCDEANSAFGMARQASLAPEAVLTLYEASVARDCQKNAPKAKELLDAYEKERQKEDIPLN
jgi:hypothetical protein